MMIELNRATRSMLSQSRCKMGQAWIWCPLFLSMLVSSALASNMQPTPHSRILGGQQAYLGALPYMALLQHQDGICSASIITQNWLVTAAHCTLEQEVEEYMVVAGIVDLGLVDDKAQMREVEVITPHPNHQLFASEHSAYFDISLVKVKEPFEWSDYIQPIKLNCQYEAYEPGMCFAAGFAETEDQAPALRSLPIQTTVTSCEQLNDALNDLNHHICYGIHNLGEHLLQEDFGGPLVCNGQSVGVATAILYPTANGNEDIVQVHTSIPYFVHWIEHNTDYVSSCN